MHAVVFVCDQHTSYSACPYLYLIGWKFHIFFSSVLPPTQYWFKKTLIRLQLALSKSPTREGKDEMDITNPNIPEDLRHFLKDISIPPQEEDESEDISAAEAAR